MMSNPIPSNDTTIAFTVNDRDVEIRAPEDTPLLMALRHDLELKGTRIGCGEGNCGACTVLIDGLAVQSCTTPLWAAKNHRVQTIEGLANDRAAQQLQAIFLAEQAAQCGYCINGIIMTVAAMLAPDPPADRDQIVATLDERHLCRCGSQVRILRAVDRAIAERKGRRT
ncbi:MAG: (2Fe-2S)-binding protein [Tardiphaga sp.]|jgi:nicotinate dehydrogenase subunit A|nr:(2Fe-2S)-binding protein [Tardiphaga sp.]